MQFRFRVFSAILPWCLFLLMASQIPAQQPQQPPVANSATVIKANVNEVLVPVVVRDSQGHAVENLKKEDFQVLDDGKPQSLTGFMVLKRGVDTPGPTASVPAPAPVPNGSSVAPQPASMGQRFVVFLFDDLNLSSSDLAQAQQAATKVLETSLSPSDTAAVLSSSGFNSGLTRDRGKLKQAIMNLKTNTLYRHDSHDCPNVDYYQGDLIVEKNDAAALRAAIQETLTCANMDPSMTTTATQMAQSAAHQAVVLGEQDTRTNLSFLQTVVSKMGALPGQRVLIFISPGFLTPTADAMTLKSQVLEMAARGNVIISAIDARGLYTTNLDASEQGGGSPLAAQMQNQYRQASMTSSENVMAELADGTGGSFFRNSNDLEGGFTKLISGPGVMYLLAFSTSKVKPNGAYHDLKVKVNLDGAKVQARRGYFAPQAEKEKK